MARDPNQVVIRGRLTRDPELRSTPGGVSVCNLGVVSSGRQRNRETDQWEDGEPFYWECEAWRALGEHAAASLSKGDEVIVVARPRANDYQSRDGSRVKGVVWQAESLAAGLDHATVVVTRTRSAGPSRPAQQAQVQTQAQSQYQSQVSEDPFADPWQ